MGDSQVTDEKAVHSEDDDEEEDGNSTCVHDDGDGDDDNHTQQLVKSDPSYHPMVMETTSLYSGNYLHSSVISSSSSSADSQPSIEASTSAYVNYGYAPVAYYNNGVQFVPIYSSSATAPVYAYSLDTSCYPPVYTSSYQSSSTSALAADPHSSQQSFSVTSSIQEQISSPDNKVRSRGKRKKDPSAPKNPLSAYLFFVTEQRSNLAGKSSKSFADLAKELGQQWKEMSDQEKAPYQEMAKKDKERFQFEKRAFERRRKNSSGTSRGSNGNAGPGNTFSSPRDPPDDSNIPFAEPV